MDILLIGGWIILIFLGLSLIKTPVDINLRTIGWFFVSIMSIIYSYVAWIEQHSIVQSSLSIILSILAFYISYLILNKTIKLRQTTFFITISTSILLFVYSIPTIQWTLISSVAEETQYLLHLLGYDTILKQGEEGIYIVFNNTTDSLRTQIVLACTGIGSIALFIGFISAINTIENKTKVLLTVISVSTIYLLNIVRNAFIAGAYGNQWFHIYPKIVGKIFGRTDEWVSFYIADKVISQIGSVVFMILFAIFILNIIGNKTKLFSELDNLFKHIKNKFNI